MKKLLILGTSVATKEIIEYAKKNGIYTIVTDDRDPEVSYAKKWADEYWMVNTSETEKLANLCVENGINGVICGLSEFNIEMMIRLTERLGLPCYTSDYSWHFSKDKDDFKKKCIEYSVPIAKDYYVSSELTDQELESIEYPVVVKPVDQNGNRGISYCYNKEELREAYTYALSMSKSDKIIIEKMLKGKEWYSYYAMADGEVRLLALNGMYSQPGELKNLYSLTTTVSDNVERFINEINPQIESLLKGLNCNEGIAWVQEMLDEDGNFYVIEMGYRLPGDMTFIQYEKLLNFDTIKWLVDYSLGEKHQASDLPVAQTKAYKRCGCSYNLWVADEGVLDHISGVEEVIAATGASYHSSTRQGDKMRKHGHVGTFAFVCDDCNEMCKIINTINDKVSVVLEDGRDVLIRYTDFEYIKSVYEKGLRGE